MSKESITSTSGHGSKSDDLFNILDFKAPTGDKMEQKTSTPSSPVDDDVTGQQLKDFYTDSVLLITGGTGFLGRVLLQKLVRTFSIKRIYLLVRKKDTSSVEERMDELFQGVVRRITGLPRIYLVKHPFTCRYTRKCEQNVPTTKT